MYRIYAHNAGHDNIHVVSRHTDRADAKRAFAIHVTNLPKMAGRMVFVLHREDYGMVDEAHN